MDIRGLILVNATEVTSDLRVHFAPAPLALLDVAGGSALARLAERLRMHGISPVTTIIERQLTQPRCALALPPGIDCRTASSDCFWRAGESAFNDMAQGGVELVLLIRLGAYAEIDFERLVQFHLDGQRRVSRAIHGPQALDIFCMNASRRNDAASLFRSRLERCRSECGLFVHHGYLNPLSDARDLRQFGIDVLTLKTETRPAGTEVRPGVWVSPGATIEKSSRILAPAFIGASARIRAGAVVTRCTSIEHHARVDCGTVVENSTVLPYSSLGAGLDLAHSVVGMRQIANLRLSATVAVADPTLVGQVSANAGQRLLSAVAELPKQIRRRLFTETPALRPRLKDAPRPVSPVRGETAIDAGANGEFASNLAVATRRYGNQ